MKKLLFSTIASMFLVNADAQAALTAQELRSCLNTKCVDAKDKDACQKEKCPMDGKAVKKSKKEVLRNLQTKFKAKLGEGFDKLVDNLEKTLESEASPEMQARMEEIDKLAEKLQGMKKRQLTPEEEVQRNAEISKLMAGESLGQMEAYLKYQLKQTEQPQAQPNESLAAKKNRLEKEVEENIKKSVVLTSQQKNLIRVELEEIRKNKDSKLTGYGACQFNCVKENAPFLLDSDAQLNAKQKAHFESACTSACKAELATIQRPRSESAPAEPVKSEPKPLEKAEEPRKRALTS